MTSPTVQRRRRRRLLAVATAGLALCIGVSVTSLAAWQQNLDLQGGSGGQDLKSSLLQIQLSLDGGSTWSDLGVQSNGSIDFGTNAALLTPGDTVYASVLLRAAAGSRAANVSLTGGSVVSNTLLSVLRYTARVGSAVAPANCQGPDISALGSALTSPGSLLSDGGSQPFEVPAATANAPGAQVGLCFGVTLPVGVGTLFGNKTASPVWHLVATSK